MQQIDRVDLTVCRRLAQEAAEADGGFGRSKDKGKCVTEHLTNGIRWILIKKMICYRWGGGGMGQTCKPRPVAANANNHRQGGESGRTQWGQGKPRNNKKRRGNCSFWLRILDRCGYNLQNDHQNNLCILASRQQSKQSFTKTAIPFSVCLCVELICCFA